QAEERMGAPFPHADELAQAREHATDINERLTAETADPEPENTPTGGQESTTDTSPSLQQLRARAADLKARSAANGDDTGTTPSHTDAHEALRQLREKNPDREHQPHQDEQLEYQRRSSRQIPSQRPPSM